MSKAGRQTGRGTEEKQPAAVPPGYLPTADPPRKNAVLLAIIAAVLGAWMLALGYLAFAQ